MNTLFLIEANEVMKLAKQGIQEADEQITLCSMELDQPLSVEEASEIIADMMVLNILLPIRSWTNSGIVL